MGFLSLEDARNGNMNKKKKKLRQKGRKNQAYPFIAFFMISFMLLPMATYAYSTQIINQTDTGIISAEWVDIIPNEWSSGKCGNTGLHVGNNLFAYSYLKFNKSMIQIPDGNIIKDAYVKVYWYDISGGGWVNESFTGILTYCYNQTWVETADCEAPNLYNKATFNCTGTANNTFYTSPFGTPKWINITATAPVINAFLNPSVKNISFMLSNDDSYNGSTRITLMASRDQFPSGYNGAYGLNPQLVLEYDNFSSYTEWSSCVNYTKSRNYTYGYDVIQQNATCYSGNTSFNYCYDNDTLITGDMINYDGKEYSITEPTLCPNGCDNITATCRPERYITDFIGIFGIVFILLIAYAVLRKLK